MTGLSLVQDALMGLLVYAPGQDVSADDAEFSLRILNRLLDRWNAMPQASWAVGFAAQTLTPALNPHTIGPSGATWTVAVRPVSIDAASLIISDVRYVLNIRDKNWYQGLSDPELSTSMPTDLYYEPAVSNGKVFLYPVPSSAHEIELWTHTKFAALALADTLTAPAGYEDAIVKTLEEDLAAPFRVPMPETLPRQAREARAIIFGNNTVIPSLCTADAGIPGGTGGSYDYVTGRNL